MKWEKYTIRTTTEAEDFVSSMLADLGVEGVQIEDNIPLSAEEKAQLFIDILPELPPDDGEASVSFFLEAGEPHEELLAQVRDGLEGLRAFVEIGAGAIRQGETEDKDWINNWKQYFKPFTVDHILIKPTWEAVPEEHRDKLMIQIDPGTAFGTGKHETTQLCIRQLQNYITPESLVLDVGTGSGILGITALKLGAKEVWGTDLDDNAITAVCENLRANAISPDRFHVRQGNIIEEKDVQSWAGFGRFDIVVANILAPVIILLQNEIPRHLKPGGVLISSGIINTKEADVRSAIAANQELELVDSVHQGEWVSMIARRK